MKPTLTEGRVESQLIQLTLPMIWGIFTVVAFRLTDTYFVSQLGTNELAAMSFTFPVIMAMGDIARGLGTGASSIIARAIGQDQHDRVRRLTTDSLLLSLLVVGILAGLGLVTIDPLFTALGADSQVLPLVRDYMSIWYLGMVFLVVPMVGNSAIRAAGNAVVPGLIITLSVIVNMMLDPLLIFGWGIVPALGMKGAALATVIARVTILVASLAFLHRERLLVFTRPTIHEVWSGWTSILAVGLPAAAIDLIAPISMGLLTSLMAHYGAATVAALGIVSQVESFALLAPVALSASIGPFIGQNWGANRWSRIHRALRSSFLFCLGWGGLITVLLGTIGPEITAWFDSEPAVVAISKTYLAIVPFSYGALGVVLIFSSTFNALGQPFPSVAITFTRLFLFYVPLAYLGSMFFGIPGVFGAICLSNLIVGLGAFVWNRRFWFKWRHSVRAEG